MSAQHLFSDRLRQSHDKSFRKFLMALERERFGKPLSFEDRVRDARVTTEGYEYRKWPIDALYAFGDDWRTPWLPYDVGKLPLFLRLLERVRGIR